MAGVGPDDDPTLASTIRFFGSSEALNWVDHRLSPTGPGAEYTSERLWQRDGACYRVLDPGWSDPKQRLTRTIRLMDTPCIQVQALGDGGSGYFTMETGQSTKLDSLYPNFPSKSSQIGTCRPT